MSRLKRWQYSCLVGCILAIVLYLSHDSIPPPGSLPRPQWISDLSLFSTFKPEDHHVVLSTYPAWHEEVWLCLGGMLRHLGVDTTAYTECPSDDGTSCIRYGLLDVARTIGLYGASNPYEKDDMFAALNRPLPNGRYIDTVVLATEKDDMEWASNTLLMLWQQRPADQKFQVVAVYHEPTGDLEVNAVQWGPTGALSYMTLSPHVADHLRHRQYLLTSAADPLSGIENIPIRTVIPWMPAAEAGLVTPMKGAVGRAEHTRPCRVMINGMISPERRAYWRVFADIERLLHEDGALWGYEYNNNTGQWEPTDPNDEENFKLLIFGERDTRWEALPDRQSLEHVVEYHEGYSQPELYGYMASTDMLLLAWHGGYRYLDSQASSSAFTTLEVEVPLIATDLMTQSYSFLDPSIAIVRPNTISEMDVVMLFRRFPDSQGKPLRTLERLTKPLFPAPYPASVHRQAALMLQQGWRRPPRNWQKKKRALNKENKRVWKEVLQHEPERE